MPIPDALPKEGLLSRRPEQLAASMNGMRLTSAFQPIYGLSHRRIVGFEALLRARLEDRPIAPLEAFARARTVREAARLDRSARALHMENFAQTPTHYGWLFLNVAPASLDAGDDVSFLHESLECCRLPAHRVVVEIVEQAIADSTRLSETVDRYKELGCLVAIDDFGAEASDIERIWCVSPHIVKLDRKIIVAAEHSARARRILTALVALIHESGSLALIEGVENEIQALIAMDTDADLVQGYYFARPEPELPPVGRSEPRITDLFTRFRDRSLRQCQWHRLGPYLEAFKAATERLAGGVLLEEACRPMLALPHVDRCYLLAGNGVQIGASLLSRRGKAAPSKFYPLEDAEGANWARKPYHYRAVAQPGELQVSRPYLSIANSRLCVTLSLAMPGRDGLRVLCCDVDWHEFQEA
jgi:EAL domain-containing protein (putative c-di-GMP-specific phosphodiesterase class I)